jgi:itaconate CoA-transferase
VRFCEQVLDAPALTRDERFATNAQRLTHRAALERIIEDRFGTCARSDVTALLERADIPTGAVNDIPAVAAHPQLAARGRWTSVTAPSGTIPALVPPHNLRSVSPRMGAVPALGAHRAEILAELGDPTGDATDG